MQTRNEVNALECYADRRKANRALLLIIAALLCSCSQKKMPLPPLPEPSTQPEFFLVVNNVTDSAVAVFVAEAKSHTRIGNVAALTESRLPVKPYFLSKGPRLRVYMFRGPEPCPVPRVIDFSVSKTPRVIVTPTDTVLSAYLPADACRTPRR